MNFTKIQKVLFTAIFSISFLATAYSQTACTLANYGASTVVPANAYPYFSAGSGITVTATAPGVPTLSNFSYTCSGVAYNCSNPAWWLNSAAQTITLTFSAPVVSFSVIVNGTNAGEEFYFNSPSPCPGNISLSSFCPSGQWVVTGAGNQLLYTAAPASSSLITVNNTSGATVYTLTHNGTGSGSRIALVDCIVPGPVVGGGLPPVITAAGPFCVTAPAVNLSATPVGGTWSGTGITNTAAGTFNPATAGVGTHTITYTTTGACPSSATINVSVTASPTVVDPVDQVLCANTNTAAVNFSGPVAGTTFNWTNNTPSIGLPASGSGNIAAFSGVNAGTTPVVATITVTPTAGGCTGPAQTFTITVNPTPTVVDPVDQLICANSNTTAVNFTGAIPGTTFNWTNNTPSIGLPASGSGNIAAFNAVNAGTTPVVATITVTPVSGGCAGAPQTFTITVKPLPTFNLTSTNPTVCGGSDGTITIGGLNASTSYNITYTGTGVVGPTAMISSGAGNIVITGLPQGNYSNFIVSLTGCSTTNATVIALTDPNPPTVGAGLDQTVCGGSMVTLVANNPNGAVITWNNGAVDGVAFVPAPGTTIYTVTANLAGCISTDQVSVSAINPTPINASPDITICAGTCTDITVTGGDFFIWNNYPGIIDSSLATQNVCPLVTTTYDVTSYTVGSNLIVNGDFSAGNSGFNSSYTFTNPTNTAESQYNVIPNPQTYNGGFSPCTDHTSGSGNMMVVNGSSVAGSTVWCQTIAISPNTDYLFSAWLASVFPTNPAQLQYTINGVPVGSNLNASGTTCLWNEFFTTWNSGALTSATICITNLNTNISGNDFAIDDISFSPICEQYESVTVTVSPLPTYTLAFTDPTICGGTDGTITISGLNASTSYDVTYTGTGVVGPNAMVSDGAGNIIITGLTQGSYSSFIVSLAGCATTDASILTLTDPTPPIVGAGVDQTVCAGTAVTLTANNPDGASITWTNAVADGIAFNPAVGTITYTVTANLAGCIATDQVDVTVNALPVIGAGVDQTICENSSVTLTANNPNGASLLWDNGVTNAVAFTPGVGTVTYTVTGTLLGCVSTDQVDVTVNPLPIVGAGVDQIVCDGVATTLTANNPNGAAISWSNGIADGVSFIQPVGTTNYTVTATLLGCVSTDIASITVNALPTINAGLDQAVCEGTMITLTATGAGVGGTYSWDNGITNNTPFNQPNGTTIYTVTGTNSNGCISTDQVSVTVNAMPIVSFYSDINAGCAPLTVNFTNGSNPVGNNCQWTFGDGTGTTGCSGATYTYNSAGQYNVGLTVTTIEGCTSSASYTSYINVVSQPVAAFTYSPNVDITIDNTMVQFENESLFATDYSWDFGDGSGSSVTSPNHVFPLIGNMTYVVTLTATNSFGCTDVAEATITVEDQILFFVPNAFTPDGNDINNVFLPVFTSGFNPYDFHFTIFDRWGEVLFESYNASAGWNGTYGNQGLVDDGVYVWQIEFGETMSDKRHKHRGHVTVLK